MPDSTSILIITDGTALPDSTLVKIKFTFRYRNVEPTRREVPPPVTHYQTLEHDPTDLIQLIDRVSRQSASSITSHRGPGSVPAFIETIGVINNGNPGDKYLSNRKTAIRFTYLRDMLYNARSDTMKVDIVLKEFSSIGEVATAPEKPCYLLHRIATVPLDENITAEHELMTWAVLQRYDSHDPENTVVVRVLERRFQTIPIAFDHEAQVVFLPVGTTEHENDRINTEGSVVMNLANKHREKIYKNLSADALLIALDANLHEEGLPKFSTARSRKPLSPDMTFRHYAHKLEKEKMWNGEMYLGVTIVSQLPDDSTRDGDTVFPKKFPQPGDVVVKTELGTSWVHAIRRGLMAELQKHCEKASTAMYGDTMRLFDEDLKGKWHFDLWILPQRKDVALEDLYRMRPDDSANMYFDPDLLGELKGKKPMLYMEAHILSSKNGV